MGGTQQQCPAPIHGSRYREPGRCRCGAGCWRPTALSISRRWRTSVRRRRLFGSAAHFISGEIHTVSWDGGARPAGFAEAQIAALEAIAVRSRGWPRSGRYGGSVQPAGYLCQAPRPGRASSRQIRRGDSSGCAAAISALDLRGFTDLADRTPRAGSAQATGPTLDCRCRPCWPPGGEVLDAWATGCWRSSDRRRCRRRLPRRPRQAAGAPSAPRWRSWNAAGGDDPAAHLLGLALHVGEVLLRRYRRRQPAGDRQYETGREPGGAAGGAGARPRPHNHRCGRFAESCRRNSFRWAS